MAKVTERERLRRTVASVESLKLNIDEKKKRLLGLLVTRVRELEEIGRDVVWQQLGIDSKSVDRLERGGRAQDRGHIDLILGFYDFIPPLTRSLIMYLVYDCFPSEKELALGRKIVQLPRDIFPRFTNSKEFPRLARKFIRKTHSSRRQSRGAMVAQR